MDLAIRMYRLETARTCWVCLYPARKRRKHRQWDHTRRPRPQNLRALTACICYASEGDTFMG